MTDFPADIEMVVLPTRVEYDYTAGEATSLFLRGVEHKEMIGLRHGGDGLVYVPSRGSDPADGEPTDQQVPLTDKGTVTTFCIVNVPFAGQAVECPYVCAHVLLDGADIPFQHLLQEVDAADVRMGMRVEAVWVDDAEMGPTMESIRYFRPTGEPDAPFEAYKDHV
jgi:uncharacterized OB-fold protein